ncbi:MAG TPA: serine hydrolase [Verrucomicrobiae bacterium]|nr:serine hydrolase [Verrucomicrobiae bacterium]
MICRRTFLKNIGLGLGSVGLVSRVPFSLAGNIGSAGLPRSTPEAQGVRSEAIAQFLDAIAGSKHEFHSFMFVRHGHVIAEGWWAPYGPDLKHMLYSLSKSFTSTAVGLAKTEGKLNVDDKVISFFPDKLPGEVSENLRALRIKDLLTMSVGHAQDSTPLITKEEDWARAFLALPIAHQPGTEFLYNSGATYMLSAIVQKVTGRKVIDYLTPRLFEPLGIEEMTWETCPMGINTGGWGLNLRTESLAKFAQLYLQKGSWADKTLIPAEWVQEATSFKIQQPGTDLDKLKHESDWHQGYCYQFWRCRHNAFRGDGAFGQYAIVLPEQDAVIAITSESPSMQGQLNLVWEHLLPGIEQSALTDGASARELEGKLRGLRLPPPKAQPSSPLAVKVSGKTFTISANETNFKAARFDFTERECLFTLNHEQGDYPIRCGVEKWVEGETAMPGTPPKLTRSRGTMKSKVAASGTWKDPQTFEMTWRFIETPHHDIVTCRFEDSDLKIQFMNSVTQLSPSRKETREPLTGKMAA